MKSNNKDNRKVKNVDSYVIDNNIKPKKVSKRNSKFKNPKSESEKQITVIEEAALMLLFNKYTDHPFTSSMILKSQYRRISLHCLLKYMSDKKIFGSRMITKNQLKEVIKKDEKILLNVLDIMEEELIKKPTIECFNKFRNDDDLY